MNNDQVKQELTLQMRKDGVSEHRRHLCYLDSECIFQEKLLKKPCGPFYQRVKESHSGAPRLSAQLPASELAGFHSLFYS